MEQTSTAARTAQPGDVCTHPQFHGIAVRFVAYATEQQPVQYLVEEEDEDGQIVERWEDDPYEREDVEDRTRAVVVMIGDGHRYTVDVEDLIPMEEDEDGPGYCLECGSTACHHGR